MPEAATFETAKSYWEKKPHAVNIQKLVKASLPSIGSTGRQVNERDKYQLFVLSDEKIRFHHLLLAGV